MKKRAFILLCQFFTSFFLFSTEPVLVFSGPEAGPTRVSQAVLEQAYKNIGIKVTFKYLPAERSLAHSNSGKYDGEIMRVSLVSEIYENLIKIPVPIYTIKLVAMSRKDCEPISNWHNLAPYFIGIRRGIKVAEIRTASMTVHVGNDYSELVELLIKKRIDCVVLSELQALKFTKEIAENDLVIHETVLETIWGYHFLHKKNKDIIPALLEELNKMEQSGDIERIIAREKEKILNRP